MKKVFLFPGQGSQYLGMCKDIFEFYSLAKEKFTIAENILEFDIAEIMFNGPSDTLKQTQYTQPSIFLHSIIVSEILEINGLLPSAVAGHSLGEFSALVSAKVLTFEEALKIIKVRANEMAKANNSNSGSMAAILGANPEQLEEICDQKGIVLPANLNAPGQVVISGEFNAVRDAIATAKKIGVRKALPLKVSGAFHSPLMAPARVPLLEVLNSVNFNNAKIPVYQNYNAKPSTEGTKIKSNILKQLESPVRWSEIIDNINQNGFDSFLEIGPGKILHGLNKRILNDFSSSYIGTKDNIEELLCTI